MHAFSGQYLSDYLRNRIDEIKQTVLAAKDDQLIANKGVYVASLIDQFQIKALQPHFDRVEVSRSQRHATDGEMFSLDMTFGRRYGQRHSHSPDAVNVLVYHLPISGDANLLRYDPSCSNRMSLPKLTFDGNEISFEIVVNEYMPKESEIQIRNYSNWLQDQINYINNDLRPFNASLPNVVQRIVDAEAAKRNKVLDIFTNLAIPIREARSADAGMIVADRSVQLKDKYYSAGISYGGEDVSIAANLNEYLESLGIKTFFFPVHAVPGDKLHRTMFQLANDCDRVLLICSKSSLSRHGVLNEIERVLEREAALGGASIFIPVRLDDYVFDWSPERLDIANQIRSRVIGQLCDDDFTAGTTSLQLQQIVKALTKK